MTYKVWENESENLLGTFTSEEDVREAVRENVEAYGADYVSTWSVIAVERPGQGKTIAEGAAVAEWAHKVPA